MPTEQQQSLLRYHYGTAGFRLPATKMTPIAAKMSRVLHLYAASTHPHAVGIVFTASHNPASDNGVKMIGGDGLMAGSEWERVAEQIVNDEYDNIDGTVDDGKGVVLIGRDTRDSGPSLIKVLTDGLRKWNVEIVDMGLVTTPQAHYIVKHWNQCGCRSIEHAKQQYYDSLMAPFSARDLPVIHIDCANGVGAMAMRDFLSKYPKQLPNTRIRLFNDGDGELNYKCGADHVKSTLSAPTNMPTGDTVFGASLDGDADRLIMWYQHHGVFKVLDGDKLTVLFANHFKNKLQLKTAVVQTAYANGASTAWLTRNGVHVEKTNTGVKNLHSAAHRLLDDHDCVVYFEGNGHGTVLFNGKQADGIDGMVNECTGDALSDLFLALLILQDCTIPTWDQMYTDKPFRLSKHAVPNKHRFRSSPADEEVLLEPSGLQASIDAVVERVKGARAFVRPSGTEECVRVYVEADSEADADRVHVEIQRLLQLA